MPVTALVDECPAYDLEPAEPATPLYPAPPAVLIVRRSGRDPGRRCSARPTSPRASGRSSSTTRSSARAPSAGPSRPTPRCCCCRRGGRRPADRRSTRPTTATARGPRSRSRSTATAAASPPTRTAARSRPSLECSANLACVGAEPLGLTNCLNFGNPEKPHIAWQLTRAIAGPRRRLPRVRHPGRRRQRLALQRGRRGPDLPDAGRRPGRRAAGRAARRPARLRRRGRRDRAGHRRLGAVAGGLGAVQAARRGRSPGPLPSVDLGELKALHAAIRQAVRAGALHSAHDVAEGGVAVALAECALWPPGSAPPCPGWRRRTSCSARARARSSSPARRRRWPRSARAARVIGDGRRRRGDDRGRARASPLDELDRAFTYGLADLLH